jgi:hypothetical protein
MAGKDDRTDIPGEGAGRRRNAIGPLAKRKACGKAESRKLKAEIRRIARAKAESGKHRGNPCCGVSFPLPAFTFLPLCLRRFNLQHAAKSHIPFNVNRLQVIVGLKSGFLSEMITVLAFAQLWHRMKPQNSMLHNNLIINDLRIEWLVNGLGDWKRGTWNAVV